MSELFGAAGGASGAGMGGEGASLGMGMGDAAGIAGMGAGMSGGGMSGGFDPFMTGSPAGAPADLGGASIGAKDGSFDWAKLINFGQQLGKMATKSQTGAGGGLPAINSAPMGRGAGFQGFRPEDFARYIIPLTALIRAGGSRG